MRGRKKAYRGMNDPRRFHADPGQAAPAWWKSVDRIVVTSSRDVGGLCTFGIVFSKNKPIAGIKVFNPYNSKQLCQEEYDILSKVGGEVAPQAYMMGSYDWADAQDPDGAGVKYPAIIMDRLPANERLLDEVANLVFSGGSPQKLSAQRTMEIGLSIARAIEKCYNLGVSHRDLSPNNIFIHVDNNRIGDTLLIDFGSGAYLNADPRDTMGKRATPHFAAPEMCADYSDKRACPNGETLYSQRKGDRVDVWSLGAIMYYLYTKHEPHAGELKNDGSNALAVKEEQPIVLGSGSDPTQPRDGYERVLEDLILHCTKFYPEDRPSIASVIRTLESNLPAGGETPPPTGKAQEAAGDAGTLDDAVGEFSHEFNMDIDAVRAILESDGRDVDECYSDILNGWKWKQISTELSRILNVNEEVVSAVLPRTQDITPGRFTETFHETRKNLENLVKSASPHFAPPTFTVIYHDGLGGKVFPDKVFTVSPGSPTPLPDLASAHLDEQDMMAVGWDKPLSDTVECDAEYTMLWRDRLCFVVYRDGRGGDVFDDKMFTVKRGEKTPEFDVSKIGFDFSRYGFDPIGWSPKVAKTVDADAEYTMTWEEKTCTVIFHDGVNGLAFPDKVYKVRRGEKTPIPQLSPRDLDLSEYGYESTRWARDDGKAGGSIASTVVEDVEYTMLWRHVPRRNQA